MSFSADVLGCMKDCILSLIWPKKDIYSFFQKHGCIPADLKAIDHYADTDGGMNRVAMVDTMFNTLTGRADNGLGPLRAMLQSLVTWSHFDSYYFETLNKLDRKVADRNLIHLRQLVEIRDAKIKEDRDRRAAQEKESQRPKQDLPALLTLFLDLHSGKLTPQKRGYAMEKVLADLALLAALEVAKPFTVNGEQIDGTVKYDGENYLVEAKWQETRASNEPVYQFVGKVEGKMYGRGLFVSIHGFSANVVKSIVQGKAVKTIFVDGEDLVLVLEEHLSFVEMLNRKVNAAQTKGLIYIHPLTRAEKQGVD